MQVDYSIFVRYVDESLFVPEGTNASVVETLANEHVEADALESLKTLHSIAHVFQYMENPAHELIRWLLFPEVAHTSYHARLELHACDVTCVPDLSIQPSNWTPRLPGQENIAKERGLITLLHKITLYYC